MVQVRFFQTSDHTTYLPLLRATETTCIRFCEINSIPYFQLIGLYRGVANWHATYNQISYLYETLQSGFDGWCIYCDADAYVNDIRFPIHEYLASVPFDKCLIIASGRHAHEWAVNAGIFFINLGHPTGKSIVKLWHQLFLEKAPDQLINNPSLPWDYYPNDQTLLHEILGNNDHFLQSCIVDDGEFINYTGSFIRQILRSHMSSISARVEFAMSENQRILDEQDISRANERPRSERIMNLTALANNYKSDKGTKYGTPPHAYSILYDLLLSPMRQADIDFLEIGLAVGGPEIGGPVDRRVHSPSISMWLEYFDKARIYGFDISDFSHIKADRFQFVRGDAGSARIFGGWRMYHPASMLSSTMLLMRLIINSSHSRYYTRAWFAAAIT